MGFKPPGLLVLKGDGSTPVLGAPMNPGIDWSHYQSLRIRMIAEGGSEIKIKVGRDELRQNLAPAMEWRDYQFEIPTEPAGFNMPMAIMPTDDLFATVAIESIELVPRKESFREPAGVTMAGKLDEYRNALFARCPASISYDVPVPAAGPFLHLGMGIAGKAPVTFRVVVGPARTELFSKQITNSDRWEDASVDLSAYAGTTVHLSLESDSRSPEAIALWANPLIGARNAPHRPDVLLYVICTLRPDHTSVYGYQRDTTPYLKSLAASGIVFDDAIAQAPWTKASVPSILTSLQAYTHGLVNESDTIPSGAVTLAENLRAAGYVTASIVSNPLAGRASGLERGFDYVMEYPVVQRHRIEDVDRGTDSGAINRAIMPWLETHRDEPLFLFVLSTDPHAPYRPPAAFESKFANPAETAGFNRDFALLSKIRAYGGGASVTRAEIEGRGIDPDRYIRRAIDRYDGEIAQNDHSIEMLAGKMKDLGILDRSLVVVASDHGEEFLEHGFGAHGHSLYSELIHTAMLFWSPGLLPPSGRVAGPVQLVDIQPTVLDLLGLKPPAGIEGRTLLPLMRAGQPGSTAPAVSTKLALPSGTPDSGVPEYLTDTFARVEPGWKLIYRPQAARAHLKEIELFDHRTDPGDRSDVAAQHPDVAARMKDELRSWMTRERVVKERVGKSGERTLDNATIQRLRSLGYLGGGASEKEN